MKKYLPFISGISDILLLITVVYFPYLIRGIPIQFNTYYAIFFVTWIVISITSGKYRFTYQQLKNEIMAIFINAMTVWGLLSLYVISLEKYNKNYYNLYKQILVVVIIEVFFRIIFYLFNLKKYSHNKTSFFSHLSWKNRRWKLMFIDFIAIFIAFMIMVWIKPATLRIYIPNYYLFLVGLLIWEFILSLITRKHIFSRKNTFWEFIIPNLRINAFTIILLAIGIHLLKLFNLSRLIVFGTVLLSTTFEILIIIYIWTHTKIQQNTDQSERIIGITHLDVKRKGYDDFIIKPLEDIEDYENSVKFALNKGIYSCCTEAISILSDHVNLGGIEQNKSLVLDTKTLFNIETLDDNSLSLFINRHKFNDFKRINDYLRLLNSKMELGGHIIGSGETIDNIYVKYMTSYSKPIGLFLYGIHFIFKRVLPKLPVTREIDFILTRGQRRTISKTEILGRLVYCGFKIVNTFTINNKFYFIAGKVNMPYEKENPSYGPLISLKRIGKNGDIFKIYKFRTMHPYAEYIQDYVFEKNDLEIGGKMKNDFRITGWGRLFRKLWIDELPQLVNFIRGDIKMVGVRALSLHYFSLYPKEFQEYRIKFKPGLLPPYYVDLPESMEEIVASEKKYLEAYSKYKFIIDIKYATIILFNIIFRGKRSS